MKPIAVSLVDDYLPRCNLPFDIAPLACPTRPGTPVEIRKIGLRAIQYEHNPFHPSLISCFHDHAPTWKIFKQFGERLTTIECHRDLLSIGTRKLEENMRSYRKNCGPHLGGVLIQELIGGHD